MQTLAQMMLYAVLAVTSENLIFTGGIGFSRVLRAARRPKTALAYSGLVCAFTLASAALGIWFGRTAPAGGWAAAARPVLFACGTAAVYLAAAFVWRTWWPKFYKKVEPFLSSSAINSVVLSMPFLRRVFFLGPWQMIGYALGTGAAFLFASAVLSQAMGRMRNPDMPQAFQGLPAVFLYVGILSLAFFGFTGGRLF